MWIKVGSEDSEKLAPKTFRSCDSHDPFGRCCLVHNIIQRIPGLKIRARFHSIGSSSITFQVILRVSAAWEMDDGLS